MAHYASWVLARNPGQLLPALPEMTALFGSRWTGLQDRGGGWQLAVVDPLPHQWPHVGGGVEELVAVTQAPVLAGWVSESSCVRVVGATPAGRSWSRHLLSRQGLKRGSCGYDHQRFATLRVPAGERPDAADTPNPLEELLSWAAGAGFAASPQAVARVLESDELNGHDRFDALVDALAVPFVADVPMLFEHQELDWWETWERGYLAAMRACRQWTSDQQEKPRKTMRPTPAWDADHLKFIELVAASVFGGGARREDLVRHARHLEKQWGAEINESGEF